MDFIAEKIKLRLDEIKKYIYSKSFNIDKWQKVDGNYDFSELNTINNWNSFSTNDYWGNYDTFSWLRTTILIPEEFTGEKVVLYIESETDINWKKGAEYLVYINDELTQGADIFHHEILLTDKAISGMEYKIDIKAFSGLSEGATKTKVRLLVINKNAEQAYYNIGTAYLASQELDQNTIEYQKIIKIVNKCINMLDLRCGKSDLFYKTIEEANCYIIKNLYLEEKISDVTVSAIGHSHIDIAWLWRLRHTRFKSARNFTTAINLMKQYPEYKFIQSQPQLYEYIKNDMPELYENIKKMVKDKRWEAEGAMWVEADCNVPSGESLVRQFLYGKQFFLNEMGVNSEVLWLPDVFGYNSSLPQIMKKCGVNYFVTSKISWNQINDLPLDSFYYVGIDGTKVLTHFITTPELRPANIRKTLPYKKTYNGMMTPQSVSECWKKYKNKEVNEEVLITYGWGDGGGGPTKEMLETAKRIKKLNGCYNLEYKFMKDYLIDLEKKLKKMENPPEWIGELYLETHRGTYTTEAKNKKYNRENEFRYLAAEKFSTLSMLNNGEYNQDLLDKGWKLILLNQFHDIIPGTSIKDVYDDSLEQYAEVKKIGDNILKTSLNNITNNITLKEDAIVVYNQTSFNFNEYLTLDIIDKEIFDLVDSNGIVLKNQIINKGKQLLFFCQDIPANGYKAYYKKVYKQSCDSNTVIIKKNHLENDFFKIEIDENGNFISMFDKINSREMLKNKNRGNVFQAFEDKPLGYHAWDIDYFYEEKMWEINDIKSIEIVEKGPLRGVLRIKKKFLDSIISQDIILYKYLSRIDFKTTIDWKQNEILLKVAFPLDINSSVASYEIQYGHVQRQTHRNTSWDSAKFEVVGHKWADISEGNFGVSLINDCKYGYDVKGTTMRLTLLRSPIFPNPTSGQEIHEFTYSIYSHKGDLKSGETIKQSYALNCPLTYISAKKNEGILNEKLSIAKVNNENIIIEVIKKSENSSDIIIRMYEALNMRTNTTLEFFKDIEEVFECDMLENNTLKLNHLKNKIKLNFLPFEIKTIKLKISKE